MVFYIKLNHNNRKKMDSRVSVPAIDYITFGDDEMKKTDINGKPKTPRKKLSKMADGSNAKINSSDEESEDEIDAKPDQVDVNGFGSTFGLHNESNDSTDDWSNDDDIELVQKVKKTCRAGDKASYKTRMRTLDWESIAFKKYSGKECENRFKVHLKNVRRHRNLSEIVNDVESNIKKCPIKKPLNSYQIFIQDQLSNQMAQCDFAETMRNASTRYSQLPIEQRAVYERKALQLRSEYYELKEAYKSGNFKEVSEKKQTPANPKLKTPFMLYMDDAKLENEDVDTSKLRENYANLSLDEKYKYVVKAVSLAPDVNQTTLLNKEEQRIFKGQVKSAPTAYCLFVKETLPKLKNAGDGKNVFAECSKRWKTLNEKQKKMYTDAAKIIKAKVKKEQEAFNERHGVTPNKIKRRKSKFCEQNTETEEALFTPPLLPMKKRKLSVSTQGSESDTDDTKKWINIGSVQKPPAKVTPKKQGPFPVTIIHTPFISMEDKRQQLNSETSDSNLDQIDIDAIDSTTPSMDTPKKKSKKEKKNKKGKKSKEIPPPDPESKPPSDLFTYFAKNVHTGKPHKARKAFDKLTKSEKKQINADYNEKVDKYVSYLKAYLATLPKEEAVAYIGKVKAAEDAEKAAQGMDNSQLGAESSQEY